MRIYLSGPIKVDPDFRFKFDRAERIIRALGHVVENPAEHPEGLTVREYMRRDLMQLLDCDAAYFMEGWSYSEGAKVEHALALYTGIQTYYRISDIPDRSEPEI